MAGRFSFSTPARRGPNDPWFRIGTIDVGSAVLLAIACIASLFFYALDRSVLEHLYLWPDDVRRGQVWRVATWPLYNEPDIFTAIDIALLWYFGSRLEARTGRVRFAWLLVAITVVPGIVGTILDLPQGGVRSIEFVVLLIFIAEYPFVRFFFGIPGWVLGAVFVGLEVLRLTGERNGRGLLFLVVSLATGAVAARSIGLLEQFPWIPAIRRPPGAKRVRGSRRRHSTGRRGGQVVVDGPWGAPVSGGAGPAAQAELDGLLDKISAVGMNGLSAEEKRRLNELSKRLRNQD